jgi:hypothetical protein
LSLPFTPKSQSILPNYEALQRSNEINKENEPGGETTRTMCTYVNVICVNYFGTVSNRIISNCRAVKDGRRCTGLVYGGDTRGKDLCSECAGR